jgi:hypothetical protein
MPRARKARKLTGGARTTTEALADLVLNPKDSLVEFKEFFLEIGKIFNNGNVGEGLRKHGVQASKLLIKYLPLGGAPGFAAATALEKLNITKWIYMLAALIDFVTGKGNIMDFLNALKELVGDIFDLIKNVVTEIIKNPNLILNPVKDAFMAVANTWEEALNPAFAAQEEAKRRDLKLLQGEQILAEEVIQDSIDEAIDTFDENEPANIDQALRYMTSLGISQDKLPRYAPNIDPYDDEADRSVLDDRPQLNEDRRKEIQGKIDVFTQKRYMDPNKVAKSKEYESQVLRMSYASGAYIVPWLLYLRDNWDKKPEWMKDVPALPNWEPRRFFELAQAPWGSGKDEYDNAMNPWYAAMGKAIKDNEKVVADKIEERRQERNTNWATNEAARVKRMDEANASRPEKYKAAIIDFAKKTNQAAPVGDDPYSDEFQQSMPIMTPADDYYVSLVVDGTRSGKIVNGVMEDPQPATAEQLTEQWKQATASHKLEGDGGYLATLKSQLERMQQGHNAETEDKYKNSWEAQFAPGMIKGADQASFMVKKLVDLIKKMPKGTEKLKELAETLPPGPMNDNFQKKVLLTFVDPVKADLPAPPAPPAPPAAPAAPAAPAEPAAPAAAAAPAAPGGAAGPEDEGDDPDADPMTMYGGGRHPFRHLESQRVRAGKRPRLQLLDPYFFEGTL